MKFSDLSIIIPTYNEEKVILDTILDIQAKILNYTDRFEIIVVDDGSEDQTVNILSVLQDIRLIKARHAGKGHALKEGFKVAKYSNILFMDADNATQIDELKEFLPYWNKFDVLIGSREFKDKKVSDKWYRKLMGRVFNFLVKVMTGLPFHDTQCGFKVFKSKFKIFLPLLREEGFFFDVEWLLYARYSGFSIKEIGVNWSRDKESVSKVNILKDSIHMFLKLFKVKMKVKKSLKQLV